MWNLAPSPPVRSHRSDLSGRLSSEVFCCLLLLFSDVFSLHRYRRRSSRPSSMTIWCPLTFLTYSVHERPDLAVRIFFHHRNQSSWHSDSSYWKTPPVVCQVLADLGGPRCAQLGASEASSIQIIRFGWLSWMFYLDRVSDIFTVTNLLSLLS